MVDDVLKALTQAVLPAHQLAGHCAMHVSAFSDEKKCDSVREDLLDQFWVNSRDGLRNSHQRSVYECTERPYADKRLKLSSVTWSSLPCTE